jgi:exopolysaccharide biosynthesis polyprenyl glycosylphosphotransferase
MHGGFDMSVLESYARLRGERSAVPRPRAATEDRMRRLPRVQHSAPAWVRRTVVLLMVTESLAAGAVGTGQILGRQDPSWVLVAGCAGLFVAWPLLLGITGTYSTRVLGTGSDEYRRVGRAALFLLALAGFISYAGGLDLSRTLIGAVPILALVTVLNRFAARQWLRHLWARGRCTRRVVVVGRGGAVLDVAAQLERQRYGGLQVVAACVTAADQERVRQARDLPVAGLDDVLALAAEHGADTVAVTSASETAAEYLRKLSWQLEGTGLELLVAPGLVEVAGPRLHIRPFEGLPFLSVEQPRFEGWQRVVKGGMDRFIAAAALVLLAPLFLAISVAVAASSPGPVFYRQVRVGLGGRTFTMLKFRSMVVDADDQRATLQDLNVSDGLLFKIPDDPRVTPIGRSLRRFSLDELPQLINVLHGSMSLVGPRPPLPGEVAHYDSSVSRRLLVKPGLTGLWQISGRSDLPWEEAVRLDLRYVENWSLALDALILWKTGRAVLRSAGAY